MQDQMLIWIIFVVLAGFVVLGPKKRRHRRHGNGGLLSRWLVRAREGRWIRGKVKVVDGDGLRVGGREIRLLGVDAPEFGQPAVLRSGEVKNHGLLVKSALVQKIDGREVVVGVEGRDVYGRILGIAWCGGEDMNSWLVLQGHALAFMHNRYKREEKLARNRKSGMWSYREAWVPVDWKHGRKKSIFGKKLFGIW